MGVDGTDFTAGVAHNGTGYGFWTTVTFKNRNKVIPKRMEFQFGFLAFTRTYSLIRSQRSQSIFQGETNSINQIVLPARNDVGWIQGNGIKLVGLIDLEFVAGALNILRLAVYAKVLDERATLQCKIGIPDFCFFPSSITATGFS
ncbi:MAG: hypothetical protein A2283_19185 [Lentisphaerae bacterium RIFOXYA12_FULL_48_11]|nr:MAG: hypothetical protein A2283_19185 [Lentisphaerae bacterium RIFOXYA12_FULL_48_11]